MASTSAARSSEEHERAGPDASRPKISQEQVVEEALQHDVERAAPAGSHRPSTCDQGVMDDRRDDLDVERNGTTAGTKSVPSSRP
jgi:hypothetical protein